MSAVETFKEAGKSLAGAFLGFGLPPMIWFGSARLLLSPAGTRGGEAGAHLVQVALVAAPLLRFAFLARPFGRWKDLDRSTRWFCTALAAIYWPMYIPVLYVIWVMFAVGWGGGT